MLLNPTYPSSNIFLLNHSDCTPKYSNEMPRSLHPCKIILLYLGYALNYNKLCKTSPHSAALVDSGITPSVLQMAAAPCNCFLCRI